MASVAPTTLTIPDFAAGSEIIARIPLANPQLAWHELNVILDSLLATPPDVQNYFQLLEHLRLPVIFVADELAKRYLNKPIPFGEIEDAVFRQTVQLQLKAARAYAHCAERNPPDPDDSRSERFATLLHRCIHFTGAAIIEHHRARREAPWGLWIDLHGYYGTAEDLHVATLPVPNVDGSHSGNTHCTAGYIACVLFDMAGSYSLSLRDQAVVRRWAAAWAPLISLLPAIPGEPLPPYVIDLVQDVALRPSAECLHTDQIRRIDSSRLAMQINHLRQQLRQRIPPAQLALGDDCTPQQCARLLDHLGRQWSQARAARRYRRHAASGLTRLCTGFEEMHYFISGQEFRQPENVRIYSRSDFESLFAFRFQENTQQALQIQQERATANYSIDSWEVVNQSANGFRLVRSSCGRKMLHGQLLALCPQDSAHFLLAQATWLMQETKGGLIAGIKVLPGLPAAICARPIEPLGKPPELYQRAFLLSAIASAGTEQSLVLVPGSFRPGRTIEIFTDGAWRVRLKHILDVGPDFERVSFEPG